MVHIPSRLSNYPWVEEAFEAVRLAGIYGLDFETTSFDPITGRVTGFSVAVNTIQVPANCVNKCCDPNRITFPKSWYFQFLPETAQHLGHAQAHKQYPELCLPYRETMKLFSEIWANPDLTAVYWNGKFDIKFQRRAGFDVRNKIIDGAVASWICDENRGTNKLKNVCHMLTGHKMVEYGELSGLFSPPIATYGADDAAQTLRLWLDYFEPQIEAEGLSKVFHELECEIVPILADMELRGTTIDIDLLNSLNDQIDAERTQAAEEAYAAAGKRFAIGSPAQVGELLFDQLNWRRRGQIKRTKAGKWSVTKETLGRYEDKPLAAAILKWRELDKFDSTYIRPLTKAAKKIDGRVRSRFNQIPSPRGGGGTVTGRLSSSADETLGGCNFQNIPSRSKVGKQIRKAFVPAPGMALVTYDFSQLELRIVTHLSQDPTLLDAYQCWDCAACGAKGRTMRPMHECPNCGAPDGHRKHEKNCEICQATDSPPGQPVHDFCLGLDIHQITADACGVDRYLGKIINFALLYGLGAEGLSRHLKCPLRVAKRIRNAYFKKYQGIVRHNARIQSLLTKHGYVATMLKRRRRFPHVKGKRVELWDREWRQAANVVVQGFAADLMKVSMRNIWRRLHAEGIEDDTGFLLQVHDEVTLETPLENAEYVANITRHEMENAIYLSIPFIAEGGWSDKSWGHNK